MKLITTEEDFKDIILQKKTCWFAKHGIIVSFLPTSFSIINTSHKLPIIISCNKTIQSYYDLRHTAKTFRWRFQCFNSMTPLLRWGLKYSGGVQYVPWTYGFPLMIEVFVWVGKCWKPSQYCKPLSQTLLKKLKRLFQFRRPHSLKRAAENLWWFKKLPFCDAIYSGI